MTTTPPSTGAVEPLLSVDEAGRRLGTPPRFVRRLVAERRIGFHGATETTLLLGEVYLRRDRWRFRVIGQGFSFPDRLRGLATRYGVVVDDQG